MRSKVLQTLINKFARHLMTDLAGGTAAVRKPSSVVASGRERRVDNDRFAAKDERPQLRFRTAAQGWKLQSWLAWPRSQTGSKQLLGQVSGNTTANLCVAKV